MTPPMLVAGNGMEMNWLSRPLNLINYVNITTVINVQYNIHKYSDEIQ